MINLTFSSKWLRPAQIAWIMASTIVLLLFLAGSIVYFQQLRQVCTASVEFCGEFDYATPVGVAQLAEHGLSLDEYAFLRAGIRIIYSLIPISLGLLIFARRGSEPIALLISFFLISFGTVGETQSALAAAYPIFQIPARAIEIFGAGLFLPLFFGLFPNGRMVPRIYWAVVFFFFLCYIFVSLDNPLGEILAWVGWPSAIFGGIAAQVYRYLRVSTAVERQQTRWVLFGFVVMAVIMGTAIVYTAAGGDPTLGTPADTNLPRRFIFLAFLNLSFQSIYLSIGMAILRSKLFDIDLIIRRTIQYSILTGTLVVVYFGTIIIIQSIFGRTANEQSPLVIVFSTLLIAALFSPLRRRIQNFIDRRFFRRKYDAAQTLAQFAQTARDEVDMDRLSAELVSVIQETMQPEQTTLWLLKPKGLKKT